MISKLALPYRVVDGRFATLEQDSPDEIVQSVSVLLRTVRGTRIEVPGYGILELVFRNSVDLVDIRGAIDRWEPRAHALVADEGIDMLDIARRAITVELGHG